MPQRTSAPVFGNEVSAEVERELLDHKTYVNVTNAQSTRHNCGGSYECSR